MVRLVAEWLWQQQDFWQGTEMTGADCRALDHAVAAACQGRLIDGRYRLDSKVVGRTGFGLWKAKDELFARTVAVELFAPASPRRSEVAAAVRAASRVVDPRLVHIYDANDRFNPPYVVSEWISGTPLPQLLTCGPLDELTVVEVIGDVAAAIAAAHREGLAHLRLLPRMVIRGGGGLAKVRGVAIRAALAGVTERDPTLVDVRGLGSLLYAGLTGLWPGGEVDGLPRAPVRRRRLCTPRQIRPELDPELDGIACRALNCGRIADRDGGRSLRSPAAVAHALLALRPASTRPRWLMPAYDIDAMPDGVRPLLPPATLTGAYASEMAAKTEPIEIPT